MDAGAAAEAPAAGLAVGSEVHAFYHANEHPEGYRFGRVFERTRDFPVVGLTSGWLPATVVGEAEPDAFAEGGARVRVFFPGTFRHPHEGYCEGQDLSLPVSLVRPLGEGEPPRPLLSILALRWHDYWSNATWSDYCVTNDGMLLDLFDGPCSVYERLPGEYEVLTVFVRRTDDLERIDPERLRARLKGQNVTVWYFLWPTVRREAHSRPGCVCERGFFRLCQRMERAALRSGWPHESHLYRQLCGKLWVPQMSLNRDFRVPPTTRVHYAEFKLRPRQAAARALDCLLRLRRRIWGGRPAAPEAFRGVAKLGFSWQGDDVLPFRGLDSLVASLGRLFEQQHSEQTVCLVQEMVPGVFAEHRVLAFYDGCRRCFHRERLWLRMKDRGRHHMHRCDVGEFSLASSSVVPQEQVAGELFAGDAEAQAEAEEQAQRLVDRWLLWFSTESPEPPQVTRLDFLAARSTHGSAAAVWTCEVGECGASLCSLEVDARNAASLNAAVLHDCAGGGRFPMPLPEALPRNRGWKS